MAKSGLKGEFFGQLDVEYIDGNMWRLHQDAGKEFGLSVDGVGVIIPKDGFCFDFASIPPVIRWAYPKVGSGGKDGQYGPAAVIHDWVYSYPCGIDRETADRIFLLGMELQGVRLTMRSLFYRAVRIGGGKYYGRPDKLNKMRQGATK